ncbi:hypothetical protein Pla163_10200 [Planctomycetes bacterium Pla163]|uniref:Uncharacterized protein n=1 Tax=Rohdeia mirabilis TaxID=2528008 RepID=A0A518CXG4_9BACT|nr:hypothetical protein Pla163_10200 [Planctomycetes bacterium Pla163]
MSRPSQRSVVPVHFSVGLLARLLAVLLALLPGLGCGQAATSTLPPGDGVELNLFVGADFLPFGLPAGTEVRWIDLEYGGSGSATAGDQEGARVPVTPALVVAVAEPASMHGGWLFAVLDTREMEVDTRGYSRFAQVWPTVEVTVATGDGPPGCEVVLEPVDPRQSVRTVDEEVFDAVRTALVVDWSGPTRDVALDSAIVRELFASPRQQLLPHGARRSAFVSNAQVRLVGFEGVESIVRLAAPPDGAWAPSSIDSTDHEWTQFDELVAARQLSEALPVISARDTAAAIGPLVALEPPQPITESAVSVPEALLAFAPHMDVRAYRLDDSTESLRRFRQLRGSSRFDPATGRFLIACGGSDPDLFAFRWHTAGGARVHVIPLDDAAGSDRAAKDVAWAGDEEVQLSLAVDAVCFDGLRPEFGPVPEVLASLVVAPAPGRVVLWRLALVIDRPGAWGVSGFPAGAELSWLHPFARPLPDVRRAPQPLLLSPPVTRDLPVDGAAFHIAPRPFDLASHPREEVVFALPAGVVVGPMTRPGHHVVRRDGFSRSYAEPDFAGTFRFERAVGDWLRMRLELTAQDGRDFVGAVLADQAHDPDETLREVRVALEPAASARGRTDWFEGAVAGPRDLACYGPWSLERLRAMNGSNGEPGDLSYPDHEVAVEPDGSFSIDFLLHGGTYTLTLPASDGSPDEEPAPSHTFTVPFASAGTTIDLGLIR